MKYLKFDESTGNIYDAAGAIVSCVPVGCYKGIEHKEDQSMIDGLIKLKNAGFSAQEIIDIKKAGIA